ncbi:uncharacterized protein LOC105692767 [Athalia rosae]|uniref:uncharacterized protein LOC105692767 n=1 Tax=Athalia rosae TaxID=37344 RepID=UPI00203480D9|nr:uncharacterized protein LOC105692767 [Athalia rosae]
MRLHVNCAVILSLVTSNSCKSSISMEWEQYNDTNSNAMNCLENMMKNTTWISSDFLLISEDISAGYEQLVSRHPNFRWELNSGTPSDLTGLFNVIIFTKSFIDLENILSVVDIKKMDGRAKYVISVGNNFADLEEIKFASEVIPRTMWKLDKMNVVFLVPCEEDIFSMTYFPFSDHCQPGKLEVLDIWRQNRFENNSVLFPEKLLDINGCPQKHDIIGSDSFAPQYKTEISESGKLIPGGVGGKMLTILAEKMNMDVHCKIVEPLPLNDLLPRIITGEVTFAVAGMFPVPVFLKYVTLDSGYMEESYGMCYLASEAEISWTNLARPLSMESWALTVVTFLIFNGFNLLRRRYRRQTEVLDRLGALDVLGFFLGHGTNMPRGVFGRYVFAVWILYSFLITATYTCSLISFLTTPKQNRVINTLQELLDSGLEFGGGSFHHEFYNDPSDPVMMEIYNKFQLWTWQKSAHKALYEQQVTGALTSTLNGVNVLRKDAGENKLQMLQERAFNFLLPIALRRGSPLTFGVRRYAARAIQGGFNTYWSEYYQRNLTKIEQKGPSPLALRHIRGILVFHSIGLIFSSVVFVLEIVFSKYLKNFALQNCLDRIYSRVLRRIG